MGKSSNNILYVVVVSMLSVMLPMLLAAIMYEQQASDLGERLLFSLFIFTVYGLPFVAGCIVYCIVFLLLEKHDDSFSLYNFSKKVMVFSIIFIILSIVMEYREVVFFLLISFFLSFILLLTKKKYYKE